jgi:hypothetical protein
MAKCFSDQKISMAEHKFYEALRRDLYGGFAGFKCGLLGEQV